MSAEAHDHHEISWWKKYVFSTDHKTIGIQYGLTAGLFLLFGFFLMIVMRWSIAYPHEPLPDYLSWMFTDGWKARWLQDGKVTGETYNMFGAMHGTIMVFLGVVPNFSWPLGRIDTFASQRIEPSAMLPSEMPMVVTMACILRM